MNLVFYTLLLLLAVVVANVLNEHFPQIALPFFLIGLGSLFTLYPYYHDFTLNSDVFALAIITPLLFNEAQKSSRMWIGRSIMNILSLSIGLVLVSVIFIGFSVYWVFPGLPLALALALTAILTPTDASAVVAIGKTSPIAEKQMQILQNESLFNDAAGIVAFDLAISGYLDHTFSVSSAVLSFTWEFIGGLVFGGVLGAFIVWIRALLIRWHDDTPTVMVTLQLLTPFLVYFLASLANFSGILAVVAAGLAQGVERDRLKLTSTRMQLVTTNVWEIIDGILSGLVFVMLGLSLPTVVESVTLSWRTAGLMVGTAFFIYIAGFLLRLLWTRYLVKIKETKNKWRDSLMIALGGAHGTITLSLAFSIPSGAQGVPTLLRDQIIFVAALVIVISLILPPVVIPHIVSNSTDKNQTDSHYWIRKMFKAGINAVRDNQDHPAEAQVVADTIGEEMILDQVPNRKTQKVIFEQTYNAEIAAIRGWEKQGQITADESKYYQTFIGLNNFTANEKAWKNIWLRFRFSFHMGAMYKDVSEAQNGFLTAPLALEQVYWRRQFEEHGEDILPIEEYGFNVVMDKLTELETDDNKVEINNIRRFYRTRHRRVTVGQVDSDVVYELFLEAFHAEYELIQQAISQKQISQNLGARLQERITFDEMAYIQNSGSIEN